MSFFIGLAIPITTVICIKQAPTLHKACVMNELEGDKITCTYDNMTIKEHPMFTAPGPSAKKPGEEMYYQCSYCFKCEVRRN